MCHKYHLAAKQSSVEISKKGEVSGVEMKRFQKRPFSGRFCAFRKGKQKNTLKGFKFDKKKWKALHRMFGAFRQFRWFRGFAWFQRDIRVKIFV